MIMAGKRKLAISLMVVAGLAACGNDKGETGGSPLMIAGQAAQGMIAQARGGKAEAAAPARTPQQMAAEALSVNPGPLVMIGFENLSRTQVMAMTGQNRNMRTYMAPSKESVILRDGMLVGTRGLGNDLSVAESTTEGLIRAGRPGQGQRVLRIYSGDGTERPLTFDCTVGPGPNQGVIVESCQGHGATFQNSYMPQGGQIAVSRQWAGPKLGYLTVQTLRP